MAEVKRSRAGQSFINKPIGVVNVTTGADRKYAAKADALTSVSNTFFNLTQQIQVKEGKKFAAKYKVRDENNNLRYEEAPFSLGRSGREAAQKEIKDKYLLALKQDAFSMAQQIRNESSDDEQFSELYGAWMKKRGKFVEQDAGSDVADQFFSNSRQLMVEHSSAMKADAFKTEQRLSASQYELDMRSMVGQMVQAQLAGDLEEAEIIRSLIEKSLDEDAMQSFKLSGEKRQDLIKALNDGYRDSRFQKMVEGVGFAGLARIEAEIESGVLSEEVVKSFPELPDLIDQYASDPQRSKTFNTFVTSLREAQRLEEGASAARESAKFKVDNGRLTNTSSDRKEFSSLLGYTSPLDAIDPAFLEQQQIENNATAPSQEFYQLAQMAKKGSMLPRQRMAFGQRLLDLQSSQFFQRRGIQNYFGGELGADMLREAMLFRSISKLGEEEMLRYYEQESDFDSLEVKTRMAKSAEYRRGNLQDKSAQDIAEYYIDKQFKSVDLPANAREQLVPQVMYFLNNDSSVDVDDQIENYVDEYYTPSYFYETGASGKYPKFTDSPETKMSPKDLEEFTRLVDGLGGLTKTYLEPISYSDKSAVYVPYQLGPTGKKNYIFRGGRMVQLNTLNFQKYNQAQIKAEEEDLRLQRQQALSE